MMEVVLLAGVAGCVLWLAMLTREYQRHLRRCVDGEPVYRLPDGRLRFSWAVANEWVRVRPAERVRGARS